MKQWSCDGNYALDFIISAAVNATQEQEKKIERKIYIIILRETKRLNNITPVIPGYRNIKEKQRKRR